MQDFCRELRETNLSNQEFCALGGEVGSGQAVELVLPFWNSSEDEVSVKYTIHINITVDSTKLQRTRAFRMIVATNNYVLSEVEHD